MDRRLLYSGLRVWPGAAGWRRFFRLPRFRADIRLVFARRGSVLRVPRFSADIRPGFAHFGRILCVPRFRADVWLGYTRRGHLLVSFFGHVNSSFALVIRRDSGRTPPTVASPAWTRGSYGGRRRYWLTYTCERASSREIMGSAVARVGMLAHP